MSLYGTGHNMVYTNQVVVPSAGDAQAVLAKLQKTHLGYLHQEEGGSKLVTRKDMEGLITLHLSTVPHKEKFPCPKFLEILRRSIEDRSDFNACKAAQAFEALEDYAVNLLSQPWRAEFRCIRLYSGFYTHNIEAHLGSSACDVLHLMGYVAAEGSEMRLDEPIDPDRVTDVSLNCLIASVECKLMMKIMEAVSGRCTVREVAYVRRHNTCSESRAADILLKRDSRTTESSSRTVPTRSKPRHEWRTNTTANQNNGYVRVDRLVDVSYPEDLPDGGRSGGIMAADQRYPPNFTSWNQRFAPTAVATNGHYGTSPLRPVSVDPSPLRHDQYVTPIVPPPDYGPCVRRQSSDPHPTSQDGWDYLYDQKDRGQPPAYDSREVQRDREQPVPPARRDPNGYARRRLMSEEELPPPRQFYSEPEPVAMSYGLQKRYSQIQAPTMLLPSRTFQDYPYSMAPIACQSHNHLPPFHPSGYERDVYGTSAPTYCNRPHQAAMPCPVIVPKHVCRAQVNYQDSYPPLNGTNRVGVSGYAAPVTAATGYPAMCDDMQAMNLRNYPVASKTGAANRRSLYDNVSADEQETNGVAAEALPNYHHLHSGRKENPTTIYGSTTSKQSTHRSSADEEVFQLTTGGVASTTARRDWNGGSDHRRSSSSVTAASISKLAAPPPTSQPHHNGVTATKSTPSDDRRVPVPAPVGGIAGEAAASRRRGSTSSSSNHERSSSVGSQRGGGVSSSTSSGGGGGGLTWNCSSCTYLNSAEGNICEMCSRSRVRGAESSPLSSGGQECSKCTLVNDASVDKCRACDQSLKDSPTYV